MRPTTHDNWTEPGSDSFDQKNYDTAPEGVCVYCGDYDPEFREHFMNHFAASGAEYGRYAAAYGMGHDFAHSNREGDWAHAESRLREDWERRGQGPWDDFKEAVRYGWSKVTGKK
ncbi:MAG TPA: hypothetical protein VER03_01065 [Bryobacteraceae bacterium]|nr:hypothetical protein [Bryobacteraceae bacterium]